jgi:hypothetical protein
MTTTPPPAPAPERGRFFVETRCGHGARGLWYARGEADPRTHERVAILEIDECTVGSVEAEALQRWADALNAGPTPTGVVTGATVSGVENGPEVVIPLSAFEGKTETIAQRLAPYLRCRGRDDLTGRRCVYQRGHHGHCKLSAEKPRGPLEDVIALEQAPFMADVPGIFDDEPASGGVVSKEAVERMAPDIDDGCIVPFAVEEEIRRAGAQGPVRLVRGPAVSVPAPDLAATHAQDRADWIDERIDALCGAEASEKVRDAARGQAEREWNSNAAKVCPREEAFEAARAAIGWSIDHLAPSKAIDLGEFTARIVDPRPGVRDPYVVSMEGPHGAVSVRLYAIGSRLESGRRYRLRAEELEPGDTER